MAKRDFNREFNDLEGTPIVEEGKKITLKTIVINSLLANLQGDSEMSGEKRIGLFSLATRVNEGGCREYTVDELSTIKNRLLKTATTLAYARVCEEIDKSDEEVAK